MGSTFACRADVSKLSLLRSFQVWTMEICEVGRLKILLFSVKLKALASVPK
jgi:hypothetical protein